MKFRIISRSLFVVVLFLTTLVLMYVFPNADKSSLPGVVVWLPENIEGHKGHEIPVSELEKKWLPEDTTQLKMYYVPHGLTQEQQAMRALSATLIVAGSDKRSLHRPEVCMTGQGWTIQKREVVEIETIGGLVEVMDLWLIKTRTDEITGKTAKTEAHYVYWWVGARDSTPHSFQRLLRTALNNIFYNINDRWSYPSVMVSVDPSESTDLDKARQVARKRVFNFISLYAPKFQKSLGAEGRKDARPLKKVR